jgi:uncharacterized membrane protein YqjE
MTRQLLWVACGVWALLVGIVWIVFVPTALSAGTFTLLALTGPLFLAVASTLWRVNRPAASARQTRAEMDGR